MSVPHCKCTVLWITFPWIFPSLGVFQIYCRDPKLLSTFKHFLPYWMLSSEILSFCVLRCYSLVFKLSWNKCNSHSFFLVSEDMSLSILSALFFLSCSMNFITPLLQPLPMIRLAILGLSIVLSVWTFWEGHLFPHVSLGDCFQTFLLNFLNFFFSFETLCFYSSLSCFLFFPERISQFRQPIRSKY